MKIGVLSDLHFNTQPEEAVLEALAGRFERDQPDLFVVAGDTDSFPRMVPRLATLFPGQTVVAVAGNHEPRFTGLTISEGLAVAKEMAEHERAVGNPVYVLENDELVLNIAGVSLRLLGATLWTDFKVSGEMDVAVANAARWANDHRLCEKRNEPFIRGSGLYDTIPEGVLSPFETESMHRRSRSFFERRLRQEHDGPTVVISHHLPSKASVSNEFMGHPLTPIFASEVLDVLNPGVALWVHGHTHTSLDYETSCGTRVVCNPLGKTSGKRENPAFDPALQVELVSSEKGWAAI